MAIPALTDYLATCCAVIFPSRCEACGGTGDPICTRCERDLLRPALSGRLPVGLDDFCSAYAYQGAIRKVISGVKYRNFRAAVPWLAESIVQILPHVDFDCVVHIPTTKQRRRERGFDHAELLAVAVAKKICIPHRAALSRLDDRAQTGRDAFARRSSPPRFSCLGTPTFPKRVLLIDDVATTGATLQAAAAVLRSVGCVTVTAGTTASA